MQLTRKRIKIGKQPPPRRATYNALDPIVVALNAEHERSSRRAMRFAMIGALVLHVVVFVVTFPRAESRIRDPSSKRRLFAVKQVRFMPPEARPQLRRAATTPKARRIPVPDPTPFDPEPLQLDELELPQADFPDVSHGAVAFIPEAPPGPGISPMHVDGDVAAPERIYTPQPVYAEEARQTHVQGIVILQTIIDVLGNVTDIKILKGLPSGLTEAAVDAVSTWRFRPARLDGEPVSVYYMVTVTFSVQ